MVDDDKQEMTQKEFDELYVITDKKSEKKSNTKDLSFEETIEIVETETEDTW